MEPERVLGLGFKNDRGFGGSTGLLLRGLM